MDERKKAILEDIITGKRVVVPHETPQYGDMTIAESQAFKRDFVKVMERAIVDMKLDIEQHVLMEQDNFMYDNGMPVKHVAAIQIGIFFDSMVAFFMSKGFSDKELQVGMIIGSQFDKTKGQ